MYLKSASLQVRIKLPLTVPLFEMIKLKKKKRNSVSNSFFIHFFHNLLFNHGTFVIWYLITTQKNIKFLLSFCIKADLDSNIFVNALF